MARINEKRVSDFLNYEKDIKGKRLIRLYAGVGSGKNYAIRVIAEKNPELRILLITSRKNVVLSQFENMKASRFLDLEKIIDNDKSNNSSKEKIKRVVCTNASIEKYFKNTFNSYDENTHLWKWFDLIVLDEAHSLTTDATFTDCFYTDRFLRHTYLKNKSCDIVYMSGTQEPIDWIFDEKIKKKVHELDYFDKCVHLEPRNVIIMPSNKIADYIYHLIKNGQRIVYFANFKKNIADLTTKLFNKGISSNTFGFSFNYSSEEELTNDEDENGNNKKISFPKEIEVKLADKVNEMNTILTTTEIIPDEIKILFTTSKNKEGINIKNDDIKITFAETHSKYDLIQMAGRVRGDVNLGTGIDKLVIVSDEKQYSFGNNEINYIINKNIVNDMDNALAEYISHHKNKKDNPLENFLKYLEKNKAYKYIKYDYISESFILYKGRKEGERQYVESCLNFEDIKNSAVLIKESTNNYYEVSSEKEFKSNWFKWSECINLHISDATKKQRIVERLKKYLVENKFLDKTINQNDKEKIDLKIRELLEIYEGYRLYEIKYDFKSLKPALNKLGFNIEDKGKGKNRTYLITKIKRKN